MIALVWLFLCWLFGWRVFQLLIGDPASLFNRLTERAGSSGLLTSPWPGFLFQLAASLWIGLLPMTWLTYGLAAFLSPILPLSIHPLLVVNTIVLIALFACLVVPGMVRLARRQVRQLGHSAFSGPTLLRSLQNRSGWFFVICILIWIILGLFLMSGTFRREGTSYLAGYSVFSDFAPHTALVSSFSQGRNWPTEYPHFANDGIAYHFMFYFLCGNLNYLGLTLDLAINLPSILGLATFGILLGILAVALTGRRATFLIAPALLFLRSSFAFITYLVSLIRTYGAALPAWPKIIGTMLNQSVYIGNTPHDDWGLWGVNVYANQRHLLPGLSIALIILILFLPDLQDGLNRKASLHSQLFSRDFWLIKGPDSWRRLSLVVLLGILLPYFHGSALVALILVLTGMALFARNRLAFAVFGLSSVLAALVQARLFAGQVSKVVQPKWLFGFLAPDPTIPGVLIYLLEMSGLAIPLMILCFWRPGRLRKIMIASFCLPMVFALTISLTPDVTVNHKYIIISLGLCNIYVADLLARLWAKKRRSAADLRPVPTRRLVIRRLATVLLAIFLTVTGVQEMVILHNINRNTVSIDSASPLVIWIKANTRPDAVFVSAPYHYNSFYLSGRMTWVGHSYYAWSAGHDTHSRLVSEQWLLAGGDGDPADVRQMIIDNGLDYLLLDNTLRSHPEFSVNESFFDQYFPVVAEFPNLDNLKIYDLRSADSG